MPDLLPIFICALLPMAVVLISAITKMNADNKRAQILIKAIETNNSLDADKLAESLRKPKKTPREILNLRLLRGCIFTFSGLALIIVGIVNYASTGETTIDPVTVPLIFGGAAFAVGLSYMIVYFVTRKDIPTRQAE